MGKRKLQLAHSSKSAQMKLHELNISLANDESKPQAPTGQAMGASRKTFPVNLTCCDTSLPIAESQHKLQANLILLEFVCSDVVCVCCILAIWYFGWKVFLNVQCFCCTWNWSQLFAERRLKTAFAQDHCHSALPEMEMNFKINFQSWFQFSKGETNFTS